MTALQTLYAAFVAGSWSWLIVPVMILLLLATGLLLHHLAQYLSERTQASQVARLVETMASVAQGIGLNLLTASPAAGAAMATLKAAAVAQGVAYVKARMPDTIAALKISDDTLAARLDNSVAGALLQAPGAALQIAAGASAGQVVQAAVQPALAEAVQALAQAAAPAPAAG